MISSHLKKSGNQSSPFWRFAAVWILILLTGCQLIPEAFNIGGIDPTGNPPAIPVPSTPLPTYSRDITIGATPKPLSSSPSPSPTLQIIPQETTPPVEFEPLASSDLLYISQEKLMRWDYVTDYSVALVDKVIEYSLRQDGKQIALLRTRKIAVNGEEIHDLDLFDMESKQITRLLSETARLSSLAISPDGNWLAFVNPEQEQNIYALSIDPIGQPINMGVCQPGKSQPCSKLIWSPDSSSLLWSDSRGLWISRLDRPQPKLVHPNSVSVIDPEGVQSQVQIYFSPIAWSPNGRFILTNVSTPSGYHWYAILDSKQSRMVEIPSDTEQRAQVLAAEWLENGRLLDLTGSLSEAQIQIPILGHIWQLMPTREDLMILERTFPIASYSQNLAGPVSDTPPAQVDRTGFPAAALKDYSGFVIGQETSQPTLFLFDWTDLSLHRLARLSIQVDELIWSPDKNGVLIIGHGGEVLFLPFHSRQPNDISSSLGPEPFHFEWTMPSSRYSSSN